ncbi:MAG: GGDEF domain-containing protein [Eubacteriales bacterium]|nr:GGDEF domain-containing protein [Eubacteriales bacterium]
MKIEIIRLLWDILTYISISLTLFVLLPARYDKRKTRISALVLLGICSSGYLWSSMKYPVEGYIVYGILWLMVPVTVFAWKTSQYRDCRFLFTLCSAFTFGVSIHVVSWGIGRLMGREINLSICFQLLLSLGYLLYLYKIHPKYRSILENVKNGWKVLGAISFWHSIVLFLILGTVKIWESEKFIPAALIFCITTGFTYLLMGRSLILAVNNCAVRMRIQQMKEYEELVFVDELTGLLNRRALDHEMKRLEKARESFFYVMFDLNDLKRVNDEYGHFQGDVFIKKAADVLRDCGEKAIGAYRTGGDEFVLLFPDCEERSMEQKLKEIRDKCEAFYQYDNKSFGMALGYGKIEDYESDCIHNMLIRSDRDMYRNKVKMKKGSAEK